MMEIKLINFRLINIDEGQYWWEAYVYVFDGFIN